MENFCLENAFRAVPGYMNDKARDVSDFLHQRFRRADSYNCRT